MKQTFILAHSEARNRALNAIHAAPDGMVVTICEKTRSLDQNALLWPLLTEVSATVDWYGNKLTKEEWKDVFTAALKKQKVVPGIDGGFVVVGQRTSSMGKSEFSELIELIMAFAADHGVRIAS
ncbi:MAG: recombination protein NinB [Thiobacillus sp.]